MTPTATGPEVPPVRLTFGEPELEASSAPAPYDLLLGVVGTVRLVATDGRLVYEEVLFPIVELAVALDDWLAEGAGADFSFDSLEHDGPGQLWCRREVDGWRVGSVHEYFSDPTTHAFEEVVQACSQYVRAVEVWLDRVLGRQLEEARP